MTQAFGPQWLLAQCDTAWRGIAHVWSMASMMKMLRKVVCADLVSPGGCVVIDDWLIVPCQKAVKDFFQEHGMNPKIHDIDGLGSYFCIDKAVSLKHHVYEKFNAGRTA